MLALLNTNGKGNVLAVRLENKPQSSRWYPGTGLYRNVHLIITNEIHIPVWGTYVTTPFVSGNYASVKLKTKIENIENQDVRIITEICDKNGKVVAKKIMCKESIMNNYSSRILW